jgi:NAD(P)-dependent dehydrogenase (short-subunit alcohol dehydrogenase family)
MPTVLVTGASRGLGLEFTRQYAAEGWHVLACARDPGGAAALRDLAATAAPGRIVLHALDVADHDAVGRLAAQLADAAIDVLINSAGTMGNGNFAAQGLDFGRFGSTDYADWERVLRINVLGPMRMAEAFVAQVARSGQRKIVTLTSILGSIARNTRGSLYGYRSSKAAVNAVMKSMSIDLAASHGIAAAAIHPGWVRTDMGGPRADIDAQTSVAGMRRVIDGLTVDNAGRCWMYDGSTLPW